MKKITILACLVFVLVAFGVPMKAKAVTGTLNNVTVDNSNYSKVYMFEINSSTIYVYLTNNSLKVVEGLAVQNLSPYPSTDRMLVYTDGVLTQNNQITTGPANIVNNYNNVLSYYVSDDVYYGTTLVFQKPLPPTPLPPLQQVAQQVTTVSIFGQIISLLPLVIGLLVLVIAFRKAWLFLVSMLHKA